MLVRLGRSFAFAPLRHRSAHELTPLRARYLAFASALSLPSSSASLLSRPKWTSKTQLGARQRARRSFATMHRSPAAMLAKPTVDPDIEIRTPRDPNTLSNYHNYVTRHTSVDFDIDFSRKRLFGSVVLTLESLTDEDVKDVVLDCRYVQYELIRDVSAR
jgi:hypothetical protein